MELTYDSYLEHYGVKGTKWGVRKSEIRGAKRRKKAAIKELDDKYNRIAANNNNTSLRNPKGKLTEKQVGNLMKEHKDIRKKYVQEKTAIKDKYAPKKKAIEDKYAPKNPVEISKKNGTRWVAGLGAVAMGTSVAYAKTGNPAVLYAGVAAASAVSMNTSINSFKDYRRLDKRALARDLARQGR